MQFGKTKPMIDNQNSGRSTKLGAGGAVQTIEAILEPGRGETHTTH